LNVGALHQSARSIGTLQVIHKERSKPEQGCRRAVGILNRSVVVFLVACWEAFVEDLAMIGARHLAAEDSLPDKVPEFVRKQVCRRVRDGKQELAPWQLTGTGWRRAILEHAQVEVARLNTPTAANVDELLWRCLGVETVSSSWILNGSANRARRRLDKLVRVRGSIAHRVSSDETITVLVVESYESLILEMAVSTAHRVKEHLQECTGKAPWRERNRTT
jgi:hypothetical protein